jgi:hypothetical protein
MNSRTDTEENIGQALLNLVSEIPKSEQHASPNPNEIANSLAKNAARKSAITAGALSLPPGALGWMTILPELLAVWRIQTQMVADIAAVYGHTAILGKEQMIYCLFRHTAAQALRDLGVRVGERLLISKSSLRVLQKVARAIGIKIGQRMIGKAISRWIPVLGTLGVGGYAYFDTRQVAKTATEFFSNQDGVMNANAPSSA